MKKNIKENPPACRRMRRIGGIVYFGLLFQQYAGNKPILYRTGKHISGRDL